MIPAILILLAQFPPQSITVTIDPHLAQLTAADGTSCTLDRTPGSATPSLDLISSIVSGTYSYLVTAVVGGVETAPSPCGQGTVPIAGVPPQSIKIAIK